MPKKGFGWGGRKETLILKKQDIYSSKLSHWIYGARSCLKDTYVFILFFFAVPQIILSDKTTVYKAMEPLWMCTKRIFYISIATWEEYLVATGIKTNFSRASLWYQFCCIIRCLTLKAAWFSPTKRDCGSFFVLIVSWCSVHHSVSAVIPLCSCIQSSVRELSLQSLLILAWKTLCKS